MYSRGKYDDLIRELFDTGIASLYDPNPACFNSRHEEGVSVVRKIINKKPSGTINWLKKKLVRNSFLCGCLDYTEHLPIEYLIIGYGKKRGIGTDVYGIQYIIGDNNGVEIPPTVINQITQYSLITPKSEVIIFHNHPYNWLNATFDNLPLASSADRKALLYNRYLQPLQLLKLLFKKGGIRFYLGENGFVREIKIPGILQIMELLNK